MIGLGHQNKKVVTFLFTKRGRVTSTHFAVLDKFLKGFFTIGLFIHKYCSSIDPNFRH